MHAELLVLRLVHILGGTFWVGSALFTTFFLIPSLASLGPAGGQLMEGLQRRRLFLVLPVVALLTIASGLRLLWIASAGVAPGYLASGSGSAFAISGAAAIVAFLLSLLVARPTSMRIGILGATLAELDASQRAATTALMARLQQRVARASVVATALLVFATIGMAVGRYL